jgi:TonB family protein
LIVIDGVIAENQNMKDIDPETIKSVNVLKGETAISKYGDKGKNGVVEITLKQTDDSSVYVESLPEFPGGIEALKQFVASSMEYPTIALENGIFGRVIVGFVVSNNGEITNVKVKSGVDPSLDKEAMRIVKSMPKWIPGKQHGESVRVPYQIPINFTFPTDYHPKSKEKLHTKTDYKIGNINWVNNTVYSSAKLNKVLGINTGDKYSKENLATRIQGQVNGIYLDNGYLFSNIKTSENASNDGTINLTFTIYEGNRGKIGKIDIKGNKNVPTKDILNKIEIKPGDVFSKTKIVQSVRAISMMGKFNPEEIKPEITPGSKIPNSEFINVDLVFNVTEK